MGKYIGEILDIMRPWGFWGLFATVFVIFSMKHVAPIINAFGNFLNNRKRNDQKHEQAMKKIVNQRDQKKSRKK